MATKKATTKKTATRKAAKKKAATTKKSVAKTGGEKSMSAIDAAAAAFQFSLGAATGLVVSPLDA